MHFVSISFILSTRRIGLDQNIRAGNFQDSTQYNPAIIPLHEVIKIDPIEEQMISHTAVGTIIAQREKYIKANTGVKPGPFLLTLYNYCELIFRCYLYPMYIIIGSFM